MSFQHREAFCLMWYRCEVCACTLRFWNSRDGVTPFTTTCPSCGALAMTHCLFSQDTRLPLYRPWTGQPVWIDMTREQAEAYANRKLKQRQLESGEESTPELREALIKEIYRDGQAPDLMIWGFQRDINAPFRPNWWPKK